MYTCLSPGAIGVRGLSLADAVDLARRIRFGGVDFNIREAARLAEDRGVDHVKRLFEDAGVRPGQWGLPVSWRNDETYEQELSTLPGFAELGRELGCTRTTTVCMSGSDERDYDRNWSWHLERLRPIAETLARYDCRLGIEFLGPATIRLRFKHEFVSTLGGAMDLARAIGTGNIGLLFDVWHHFTSGGTPADLDGLTAGDIIAVHANDAPKGLKMSEYVDNDRRLPMETGVIDLPEYLRRLSAMGYDGPVTPEPFSRRINELAARDASAAGMLIAECMDAAWKAAGL
jgi:sugar phosphate isomerase/epimerase